MTSVIFNQEMKIELSQEKRSLLILVKEQDFLDMTSKLVMIIKRQNTRLVDINKEQEQ